jgi:hypothetical protein
VKYGYAVVLLHLTGSRAWSAVITRKVVLSFALAVLTGIGRQRPLAQRPQPAPSHASVRLGPFWCACPPSTAICAGSGGRSAYLISVGRTLAESVSASMTKRGEDLLRIAAGFIVVAAVLAALVIVLGPLGMH